MTRPSPAALVLLILAAPATATTDSGPGDADAGLQYLLDTREGGSYATWARLVAEAASQAGHDIKAWPTASDSVYDALDPTPAADCPESGSVYNANLRLAHAVGTSGYDPRDVHGVNLYRCVRAGFDGTQSGDAQTINDDVWAILALWAGGLDSSDSQIRAAAEIIQLNQRLDGGWSYNGLGASNTDLTGMALVALAAADDLGAAVRDAALGFLDSTYDPDTGAHRDLPSGGVGANCQSTVWALHGYSAAGETPRQATRDYIGNLQNTDGGFARRSGGSSDAFCTAEAIPVAAGSLHPWPRYAPGHAGGDGDPYRNVRQALRVASDAPGDLMDAVWTIRSPSGSTSQAHGAEAHWLPDDLGTHDVAVHATGAGTVFRTHLSMGILNRLPLLDAPAEAVADRVAPLVVALPATDPDGDPVTVRWRVHGSDGASDATGSGTLEHTFTRLGRHTVTVTADDGHDETQTAFPVLVLNLPPEFVSVDLPRATEPGATIDARAAASDADGPEPTVTWVTPAGTFDGPAARFTLQAGEHVVVVRATDADGAVVERRRSVLVAANSTFDATAQPAAPAPEGGNGTADAPPAESTDQAGETGLPVTTQSANGDVTREEATRGHRAPGPALPLFLAAALGLARRKREPPV